MQGLAVIQRRWGSAWREHNQRTDVAAAKAEYEAEERDDVEDIKRIGAEALKAADRYVAATAGLPLWRDAVLVVYGGEAGEHARVGQLLRVGQVDKETGVVVLYGVRSPA